MLDIFLTVLRTSVIIILHCGLKFCYLPVKHELVKSLGGDYTGTATLKLIDILGKEITTDAVVMSKKVQLLLTVDTADYLGVIPYDCRAVSKDLGTSYRFLLARCGDGTIIPKTKVSQPKPFQEVTKKPQPVHSLKYSNYWKLQGGISYECSFTVCNATCDGVRYEELFA